MATYIDGPLRGLIQPGDQAHQCALGAAGAAQNTHGHTAGNGEVDIRQVPLGAVGMVFEVNVVKADGTVGEGELPLGAVTGDLLHGIVVGDLRLLLQHLHNALAAGDGAGQHHHHHGHHHQGHENFGGVGEEGQQVAGEHLAAGHIVTAQPHDGYDGAAHNEVHHGDEGHHEAEGPLRRLAERLAALEEFLLLPVLPDERLHHPDSVQILLHHQIQSVGGLLQGGEEGPHIPQYDEHHQRQQRQDHQKDLTQLQTDAKGHHQSGDEHHRSPYQHPHPHHQGHLHRRDVVGEPGDEGGSGKVLDVGKGEALYLPVLCVTDVGAEAHAGLGGQRRCAHAQRQTDQGHQHHLQAHGKDVAAVSGAAVAADAVVHDAAHGLGQHQLQHRFACRAEDAQQDVDPIPLGIRGKLAYHSSVSSICVARFCATRSR